MLIRSQNRKTFVNLNNISNLYISNCGIHVEYVGTIETYERIALYSTEEKAIKVLDMIQKEYLVYTSNNGGGMLATANFYIQPFAFNHPKVFQMPQDDEVEV